MRLFLFKLACFLGIQCLIAGMLALIYAPVPDHYLLAARQKHSLLLHQPSPRLILVGGSNLAFGVDSGLLARRVPYHPVNLGLHASLPLKFMIGELDGHLIRGDVVVLSPEYKVLGANTPSGAGPIMLELSEYCPERFKDFSWAHYCAMSDEFFPYLRRIVLLANPLLPERYRRPHIPYAASCFNELGDVTAHWYMPSTPPADIERLHLTPRSYDAQALESAIRQMNRLGRNGRRQGVVVLFAYPSLAEKQFHEGESTLRAMQAVIERKLEIPIINEPTSYCFPSDHYYDFYYHLNRTGVSRRTKQLAADLEVVLSKLSPKGSVEGDNIRN